MKRIKKTLRLDRDTVRALTASDAARVHGGITSYELCDTQGPHTACFSCQGCP